MQHTVFDMPVVNTLLHRLALFLLMAAGWRKEGLLPAEPKYVMVAAPHTSNWDLPVTLTLAFAFRARVFWMGKNTLFRGPFGTFFRWMGGISIDRSKSNNAVEQMIRIFRDRQSLAVVVAPEGTRTRVAHWKTGFYHIANGAGVPIVLGFLDYRRKVGGVGPVITPSGNIEADMRAIRGFYADIAGKHADQSSRARVTSESLSGCPSPKRTGVMSRRVS